MTRGDSADRGVQPLAGTFQEAPAAKQEAPVTPKAPKPVEIATANRAKQVKALNAALKKYATTAPEFSVAVLDRKTGQRYSFRGTEKYETASVVKVQVLACLLLTAQDKQRDLTGT